MATSPVVPLTISGQSYQTSPAATNVTEQIVREAPAIEQMRLNLLSSAKAAVDAKPYLPAYEAAGLSQDQLNAIEMGRQGIGDFQPFLNSASQGLTAGAQAQAEAADILRGSDTRGQFAAAQQAYNNAAGATGTLGQLAENAGAGQGLIGAGSQGITNAQQALTQYAQADLSGAQNVMGQGIQGLGQFAQADMSAGQNVMGQAIGALAQAQPNYSGAEAGLDYGVGMGNQAAQMAVGAVNQPGFQTAADMYGTAAQMAANAGPSDFSTAYGLMGQGVGTAGQATQNAFNAAQQPGFEFGIGQLMQGAQQGAQAAQGVSQATAPQVQAAQMGNVPQVGIAALTAPEMQAAQGQVGQQVQTSSFTDPGAAQAYMSPYMQNVVDIQQREAMRQAGIAQTQRNAQAVRAGAFGGSRQAILDAEAQRNLATQLGDIQATGLQSAFQQGQQQFNAEQAANLQAQQANQQAAQQIGLANLSNEQQAAVNNQAAYLQTQGLSAQQALQAALANQQAEMSAQQTNVQAAQQANLANQAMAGQYGLQGAQMGMQAAGLTQNVGQQAINAATSSGQLGLQAAAQQFQEAGYDAQTAMNMAQLQQANVAQQAQQSQLMSGIGSLAQQQAAQVAGLGQSAAGQVAQAGQMGLSAAQQLAAQQTQQAQLGQSAATAAGSLGQQLTQQQLQQAQLGQQASVSAANIGQQLGQQQLQQAQLGQGAASQYGQLAGQQAGLSSLYSNIAGQQANIMGQQASQYGNIGQGIGALAAQQYGVGQSMASTLGNIGGNIAGMGMQSAQLGAQQQQLAQQDTNFMYNLGSMQQRQQQAQLDADRATAMQTALQDKQDISWLSDIYKGAPSTQMGLTSQAQAAPSAFQQAAGLAMGVAGAVGAANNAFG